MPKTSPHYHTEKTPPETEIWICQKCGNKMQDFARPSQCSRCENMYGLTKLEKEEDNPNLDTVLEKPSKSIEKVRATAIAEVKKLLRTFKKNGSKSGLIKCIQQAKDPQKIKSFINFARLLAIPNED